MRLLMIVILALAFAGCAKKQPAPQAPAAAPPAEETKAADSPAEGAGAPAGNADDADQESEGVEGDPCDGGENK